nr:hypothetical protein [Paraburkholderia nemoris]
MSNLSTTLRTSLLSQFTAWNRRAVETNQTAAQQVSYVNVSVTAGYGVVASQQATALQARQGQTTGQLLNNVAPIFNGQVVLCEPVGDLPNMAVRIVCYSQQIDKRNFQVQVPSAAMPFKTYAKWVATQMGLNLICDTSYDNVVITNPGASVHTVADLILDLQSLYRPNVAAFVDSSTGTLIVRDVNKIITTANTITVDEFISMPSWTEWGVRFRALFNPAILITSAVQLQSILNPTLGSAENPKQYVVYALEYDLTSRDTAFYMTVDATPPA